MLADLVEKELWTRFALHDARTVLLVGSRADGLDYAGSDIDFLAVYESRSRLPDRIPYPGAVRVDSSLGTNWVATMRGEEVNVESVCLDTIGRLSAIALSPLSADRGAVLQPLEVRLLSRLANGIPIGDRPAVPAPLDPAVGRRLPPLVATTNYHGAASHLDLARTGALGVDSLGTDLALLVAATGLGIAALALCEVVVYAPKKIGLALAKLAREGRTLPVTESELRLIVSTTLDPEERIQAADAALVRIRAALGARAAAEGGVWREAAEAIGA